MPARTGDRGHAPARSPAPATGRTLRRVHPLAPVTIVGAGRIGGALAARSPTPCALVTRTAGWDALGAPAGAPIVVATGADDLGDVLARTPAHRRPDLVFVQNGMIDPWLAERGLQANGRALLYFAVPRRGAAIEPGGTTVLTGRHADALAAWFAAMDLPAAVVPRGEFTAAALEKLIWNAAFGLLSERFTCPVGQVVEQHRDVLAALVAELAAVGRAALGADLGPGLLDRLCRYSLAIPTYRGAVKDWPWRNGWFVAAAAAHRVPTPAHDAALRAVGR